MTYGQDSSSDSDQYLQPKVSCYLYAELLKLIHDQNYQRGRQQQTSYSKYFFQLIQHFGYQEIDYFGKKKIRLIGRIKHQNQINHQWKQKIQKLDKIEKQQNRKFWQRQIKYAQGRIGLDQMWMIIKPVDFIYNCQKKRRAHAFMNGEVAFYHRGKVICSSQKMQKVGCVEGLPLFIAKTLFIQIVFFKANFYCYHEQMQNIQQILQKYVPDQNELQISNYEFIYKFPKFINLTEQELVSFSSDIIQKMQKQTPYKFRCSISFSLPICKILINREQLNELTDILVLKQWKDMKNYLKQTSIHYLTTIQQHMGLFLSNFGIFNIQDLLDKMYILQAIIGRQPAKIILHEALGADQYQVVEQHQLSEQLVQYLQELLCPAKRKLTFSKTRSGIQMKRKSQVQVKEVRTQFSYKQINFQDKAACTNGFSKVEPKPRYQQTFLRFQRLNISKNNKLQSIEQQSEESSSQSDNGK